MLHTNVSRSHPTSMLVKWHLNKHKIEIKKRTTGILRSCAHRRIVKLFLFHLKTGMLFGEHNYKLVFPGSTFNNPRHVILFTIPLITLRGHSTSDRASAVHMPQQHYRHPQILDDLCTDNISSYQRHYTSSRWAKPQII
jgi:hypothetical protein